MTIFSHPEFDDHQQIAFFRDPTSGLRAIVAIHDTHLGPAVGGCRMWDYPNDTAALADVLRLSKGMSYKNALAGLPLGGGKAVILGDAKRDKTPALLRAFGRAINGLHGRYRTAEDVGTTPADMDIVGQETSHALGGTRARALGAGDPSPYTARGGFAALGVVAEALTGSPSLAGARIAVQGLGHVGMRLSRLLADAGAELVVSDINPARSDEAAHGLGARTVTPDSILSVDADILVPCALGGILNDTTIPHLKVKAVAGLANNQLAAPIHAEILAERGVLYAPDYVVNAGGVIAIAAEHQGRFDQKKVIAKVDAIGTTLQTIVESAKVEAVTPAAMADQLAKRKIGRGDGKFPPRNAFDTNRLSA